MIDSLIMLSKGRQALSPRVKWEHLKDYEFSIPSSSDGQKRLADLLWGAYRLKEAYKRLLTATDEMVKSQFIEMFGNPVSNDRNWECEPIRSIAPESPATHISDNQVWLLNLDMIESGTGNIVEKVFIPKENVISAQPFDEGNVLFSKLRPYLNKVVCPNGKGYATTELVPLRPKQDKLNKTFFTYLLRSDQFVQFANDISGGTKMPRMPLKELREFKCILPPIKLQEGFATIVRQADKSKFGGFKSQFIEMISGDVIWRPLSEICISIQKGISPKYVVTSDIEVINQACVSWEEIDFNKVKYHDTSINHSKAILSPNDILLTMTGRGTLGRMNIFIPKHKGTKYIADGHLSILRVNKYYILPEVICRYFALVDTQNDIYRNYVTGSTNQLDIVFSEIKKMPIPLPTIKKQEEFATIARQADKSKYYVQNKLNYICHILTKQIQLKRCS